jgi:hypothetical protein
VPPKVEKIAACVGPALQMIRDALEKCRTNDEPVAVHARRDRAAPRLRAVRKKRTKFYRSQRRPDCVELE